MASSTTTLSKPSFETFTKRTFRNLLNDEDLTDVTLACDDGQLVKAHKVILAAASPFFKRILGQTAHPNPLIHIQGIKAFHLKLMLHFIYLGRATIETGDVEEFFETTRSLKIEDLEEAREGEGKSSLQEKTRELADPVGERQYHKNANPFDSVIVQLVRSQDDEISDSLDNLLEDSEDVDDVDEVDTSDAEREMEQCFVTSRPADEFKSIESDLKNLSASAKGPSDYLENIDDLNVLSEMSKNKDNNRLTSCLMINDTMNKTASSTETLKEISDKMTNQLLDFFGSESPLAPLSSQSVPSSNQKRSANVSNKYQQMQVRGQKRLLPGWMKVGDVDAKHFKIDPEILFWT